MKTTAYIITKNGKSNHLPKVLENEKNFFDYILVSVDKESSDGTYKWLKNHEAVDKVLVHEGEWPQQESEIRRRAYRYTKLDNPDADILMALDDDELIPNHEAANTLFSYILKHGIEFGSVGMFHLWEDGKYREDHAWHPQRSPHTVIENLQIQKNGCWNTDSNPHTGRLPIENVDGETTGMFGVLHLGYFLPEEEQQEKLQRKLDRDPRNWEELCETQQIHYKSFDEEPELDDIPNDWHNLYKS